MTAFTRLVAGASRRLYRLCLRRRRSHAAQADVMESTFDTLLDRAASSGPIALAFLTVRELGGLLRPASDDRDSRPEPGRPWFRHLGQDVRFALRGFRRRPAFTAVLVTTLALGIGANAAIFSVTKAVLFERLPFLDPSRLVMLWEDQSDIGVPHGTPSVGSYGDWLAARSLDGVAALSEADFNLTGGGEPEKIGGAYTTVNLFSVLGVQPFLGRAWRADEDVRGSRLVVINYDLWQHLGATPSIVGQSIDLSSRPFTVIGVMPRGFEFRGRELQIWVPIGLTAAEFGNRQTHYLDVVARLRAGVTLDQTNAELGALAARMAREHPDTNTRLGMFAMPLLNDYVGDTRTGLVALVGAVACVLIIACVNVANLLLTQAVGRAHELAIRTAIGADRGRLVGQLLTESVVLGLAGGAVGVLLAWPCCSALSRLVPDTLKDMSHVALDPTVLAVATGLSVLTGIVFGLAPAWRASRVEASAATMRQTGRGLVGSGDRLRAGLVVTEVALAAVVLVTAGLVVQSFRAARSVPLGLRPDHVLTMRIQLPRAGYDDASKRTVFVDDVLARARALPAVVSAGYTSAVPLTWKGGSNGFNVEGQPRDAALSYDAVDRIISPGYMETMGMTLIGGRFFDERDRAGSAMVAIVNETLAKQYWPGLNPLGHRLRFGGNAWPWRTVVGVVADTPDMGIEASSKAALYAPIAQSADNWMWPRDLVVRTAGDSLAIVPSARAAVWAVDRRQPVSDIRTMDALVARELENRTIETSLFGVFALLATVLAAVGIFGVLSHAVTERTPEIGVRLALGGEPTRIRWLFVRQGLSLAAIGLAAGLAIATWATSLIAQLLFRVRARDLSVFAVNAAVLLAVCTLAAYLPARRASRIDPIRALRAE